jgi:2',3'-cyclic-nucleotide 2'-phosphodiesterase / 3'-nucleotidase
MSLPSSFTTRRRLLQLGWGLLAAVLCGAAAAERLKLRILETADVHMNLLNYDYYQDRLTGE